MIPPFLISPTGIASVIAGLATLAALLFFNLWQGKVDEFAHFKSAVVAEQAALKAAADQARVESERVTADVSHAWSRALDDLRRTPAVRVRSGCDSASLRPVSATGLKPPASPGEQGSDPVEVAAAECEVRLNNAAQDALQLLELQEWIKRQHEVVR